MAYPRLRTSPPYRHFTPTGSPSSFISTTATAVGSPCSYRVECFGSSSESQLSPATPSTIGPVTPSPLLLPSSPTSPKNGRREYNPSPGSAPQWGYHTGHDRNIASTSTSNYSHLWEASAYEYPGAAAATVAMDHEVPPLPPQDWGQNLPTKVTFAPGGFVQYQIPQSLMDGWHFPAASPLYNGTSSQHTLVPNAPHELYPGTYTLGSGDNGGWMFPVPTVGTSNGVQTAPYDDQPAHPSHPQALTRPMKRSSKKRSSNPSCIYQDSSDSVGRRSDSHQSSSASIPIGEGAGPPIVCRVVGNDSGNRAALDRRKKKATHFCPICPKDFTEKHGLENHLNVHYGRKPFACEGCRREFTTRHTRNRHVKTCPLCQSHLPGYSELTFVNIMEPSIAR